MDENARQGLLHRGRSTAKANGSQFNDREKAVVQRKLFFVIVVVNCQNTASAVTLFKLKHGFTLLRHSGWECIANKGLDSKGCEIRVSSTFRPCAQSFKEQTAGGHHRHALSTKNFATNNTPALSKRSPTRARCVDLNLCESIIHRMKACVVLRPSILHLFPAYTHSPTMC